jgi:hypothetical protein
MLGGQIGRRQISIAERRGCLRVLLSLQLQEPGMAA